MTMTICGSRMYLGLVKSTELSTPPPGPAGGKEQPPATSGSEPRVQLPVPQRSYLTEGTFSTWDESSVGMP